MLILLSKKIHLSESDTTICCHKIYSLVFTTFWPLGFIAFGGPQAHIAILRDHLVVQRDWLDEDQFQELFAIGQVRLFFRHYVFYWIG